MTDLESTTAYYEDEAFNVVFPEIKKSDIRVISTLGSGTFGKVFHGFSKAVGNVAVKVCNRDKDQEKLILEFKVTLRYGAAHPNIIKLYGFYKDPDSGLSLVMEYMSGGTLDSVLRDRKDLVYYVDHIISWLHQLCSAVAHMHKCGVVHRDIKPQNILMDALMTTLKLCDLGEARVVDKSGHRMSANRGSYLYMAPEVMMGGNYNKKVDVYSIGMVLWIMFARRIPSYCSKFTDVVSFKDSVKGGLRPSKLPILRLFNDIIEKCTRRMRYKPGVDGCRCMSHNPEDRVNASDLRDFGAELLRKFTLGYGYLINVSDKGLDKLFEPINVRGDVMNGSLAPLQDAMNHSIKNPPIGVNFVRADEVHSKISAVRENPKGENNQNRPLNNLRNQSERKDKRTSIIDALEAVKAATLLDLDETLKASGHDSSLKQDWDIVPEEEVMKKNADLEKEYVKKVNSLSEQPEASKPEGRPQTIVQPKQEPPKPRVAMRKISPPAVNDELKSDIVAKKAQFGSTKSLNARNSIVKDDEEEKPRPKPRVNFQKPDDDRSPSEPQALSEFGATQTVREVIKKRDPTTVTKLKKRDSQRRHCQEVEKSVEEEERLAGALPADAKYDDSPRKSTKEMEAWYIRSVKINLNHVNDMKSRFEKK